MNKKALTRTIIEAGVCGLAGLSYYVFIMLTGISLPCYIHELTGFLCPSCGITRMFLHLAHLEFTEAMQANYMLFFLWPVIVLLVFYILYKYHAREELPKPAYIIMYALVGISLIFCIIRNVI